MSKPTKDDASLFLELFAIMQNDEDLGKAYQWIIFDLDAETFDDFNKKYPKGSQGRINVGTYAGYMEILSTFVNRELLSIDLIFDLWGDLFWSKVGPFIQGLREDAKMPKLYENYEYLAKKFPEWEKANPPKL